MNNRTILMEIRYATFTPVRGFRYEVFITAYLPWLYRTYDWDSYIFSARPTKRQISAVKRHYCKRLGRTPQVECIETDKCVVSTETAIAGVFVSDKGPTD